MLFPKLLLTLLVGCAEPTKDSPSMVNHVLHDPPRWQDLDSQDPIVRNIGTRLVALKVGDRVIGSGLFIGDSNNTILTVAHVALALRIASSQERKTYENRFISGEINSYPWIDRPSDLALLESSVAQDLNASPQIEAPSGDSEQIYLLGWNPENRNFSYSAGHSFPQTNSQIGHTFDHDADSIPGFSGGPIFNQRNALVGVHRGFKSPMNIGSYLFGLDQIEKHFSH